MFCDHQNAFQLKRDYIAWLRESSVETSALQEERAQ